MRTAIPRAASALSDRYTSARAPTSTPAVGSSKTSKRIWPPPLNHRPTTSFCWLPPENVHAGRRVRRRDAQRLRSLEEVSTFAPAPTQPPLGQSTHDRQDHVVLGAQYREDRLLRPVGRDESHPGSDGRRHRSRRVTDAVQGHPAGTRYGAGNRERDVGSAATQQAEHADDLTWSNRERDRCDIVGAQRLDLEAAAINTRRLGPLRLGLERPPHDRRGATSSGRQDRGPLARHEPGRGRTGVPPAASSHR